MEPLKENLKRKCPNDFRIEKKRKHTVLSLKKQQDIIEKVEAWELKAKFTNYLGIEASTVTNIIKRKDKIQRIY